MDNGLFGGDGLSNVHQATPEEQKAFGDKVRENAGLQPKQSVDDKLGLHIISLEAENVKRIKAVSITPDGKIIIIGGANGAGKSSVLDAIVYALAGKKAICDMPLREGSDKGYVVIETEKYTITRTFTKNNSYIEVKTKEGYTVGTPQELLNKLFGDLSFDPLAFTRLDSKKQVEVLMRILKLDFSELDNECKQVEEDRRIIGRDGKSIRSQLDAIPIDPTAPDAEVVIANLIKQLEDGQKANRANQLLIEQRNACALNVSNSKDRIDALEAQLREVRTALTQYETDLADAQKQVDACVDVDLEPISQQIRDAESINNRFRTAQQRKELKARCDNLVKEYNARSARLEAINAEKANRIANAKFPVDGLSFTSDGVLVNGLPFEQASSAEQLKISVALGLFANPELRIILIKDGSLLDESSLAIVAEMAEANNAQVFMERVGEGKEVSIVIEDGMVKEDRTASKQESE
jgi:predicted ATP-dependent endonuclease of OLD family